MYRQHSILMRQLNLGKLMMMAKLKKIFTAKPPKVDDDPTFSHPNHNSKGDADIVTIDT